MSVILVNGIQDLVSLSGVEDLHFFSSHTSTSLSVTKILLSIQ